METFFATIALVSPFAAMNESMLIVNGASQETFAAFGAMIWPLAGVTFTDVVIKIGANGEASSATGLGTPERFDTCIMD